MGPLGSAEPGDPHVLHTGDMLGSLGAHVDPTGDMLPTLRKVHWLSSACQAGTGEHELVEEVHILVQAAKIQYINICWNNIKYNHIFSI